jgi:hypothetical protein
MVVQVLSKARHTLSQVVLGSSLAGDGLLVRVRSTSIGLLGLITAIGLGLIAYVSNQGWPDVFSGPLPQGPVPTLVHNDTIVGPSLSPGVAGGHGLGPSRRGAVSSQPPAGTPRGGNSQLGGSHQVTGQGKGQPPPAGQAPPAAQPSPTEPSQPADTAPAPSPTPVSAPPSSEQPSRQVAAAAEGHDSPGKSGEPHGKSGESHGHSSSSPSSSKGPTSPGHSESRHGPPAAAGQAEAKYTPPPPPPAGHGSEHPPTPAAHGKPGWAGH